MKFTNGYWLIRPNFQMQYATQAVRVEKRPDVLHVLSACRPIHHRGDTLDGRHAGRDLHRTPGEHHPRDRDPLCGQAGQRAPF